MPPSYAKSRSGIASFFCSKMCSIHADLEIVPQLSGKYEKFSNEEKPVTRSEAQFEEQVFLF